MSIGMGIAIAGIWCAVAAVAYSRVGELVIAVALLAAMASCGIAHG